MQPLINLKQFLAVLLLLIIPAALLTAYFRNYEPEAGGAGHQHADAAGTHPAGGHGDMAMPSGEGSEQAGHTHGSAEKAIPAGDGHAAMDHGKMEQPQGAQSPAEQAPQPAGGALTQEQIEASRLQLEASRAQLEASRKALEATGEKPPATPAPQQAQPPDAAPAQASPAPAGGQPQPKAADGHEHKH